MTDSFVDIYLASMVHDPGSTTLELEQICEPTLTQVV